MQMTSTDEELTRRYLELSYRMIECSIDPDHPASRANRARWRKEFEQTEALLIKRGLTVGRRRVA